MHLQWLPVNLAMEAILRAPSKDGRDAPRLLCRLLPTAEAMAEHKQKMPRTFREYERALFFCAERFWPGLWPSSWHWRRLSVVSEKQDDFVVVFGRRLERTESDRSVPEKIEGDRLVPLPGEHIIGGMNKTRRITPLCRIHSGSGRRSSPLKKAIAVMRGCVPHAAFEYHPHSNGRRRLRNGNAFRIGIQDDGPIHETAFTIDLLNSSATSHRGCVCLHPKCITYIAPRNG